MKLKIVALSKVVKNLHITCWMPLRKKNKRENWRRIFVKQNLEVLRMRNHESWIPCEHSWRFVCSQGFDSEAMSSDSDFVCEIQM